MWASGSSNYRVDIDEKFPGLKPDLVAELCGRCEASMREFIGTYTRAIAG